MTTGNTFTESEDAELTRLHAEGHSTAEIGRRMGRTKNSIIGRCHRLKLPKRGSPLGSSITAETRQEVRRLCKLGASSKSIARTTGVDEKSVRHIRKVESLPSWEANTAPRATLPELPRAATSPLLTPLPCAQGGGVSRIVGPTLPEVPVIVQSAQQIPLPIAPNVVPFPPPKRAPEPAAPALYRSCQYITNDGEGRRWRFCDSTDMQPGSAYCRACHRICYRAAQTADAAD